MTAENFADGQELKIIEEPKVSSQAPECQRSIWFGERRHSPSQYRGLELCRKNHNIEISTFCAFYSSEIEDINFQHFTGRQLSLLLRPAGAVQGLHYKRLY